MRNGHREAVPEIAQKKGTRASEAIRIKPKDQRFFFIRTLSKSKRRAFMWHLAGQSKAVLKNKNEKRHVIT